MEEEEEVVMQNIDIREFPEASSLDVSDYVVVSLFDGRSRKTKVGLLRDILLQSSKPTIGKDYYWYVGEVNTGVLAKGMTPVFRKVNGGVEYRYDTESETSWRPLVSFADLRMRYEDLTAEQVYALRMRYEDLTAEQQDSLRLKFEDLTEEQIKELQRPATEIAERLEEEEKAWKEAEDARAKAEQERVKAEEGRKAAETERKANAETWATAEFQRAKQEEIRVEQEAGRQNAENQRVNAEELRQEAESKRNEQEQERQQWYRNIKVPTFKNEFIQGFAYSRMDIVTYLGSSFISMVDSNMLVPCVVEGDTFKVSNGWSFFADASAAYLFGQTEVDLSQDEFNAMLEAGELDVTKRYYIYEEE